MTGKPVHFRPLAPDGFAVYIQQLSPSVLLRNHYFFETANKSFWSVGLFIYASSKTSWCSVWIVFCTYTRIKCARNGRIRIALQTAILTTFSSRRIYLAKLLAIHWLDYASLYSANRPTPGMLRPVISVDRNVFMWQIAGPESGLLNTSSSQVNLKVQVLLLENLQRTSLVDELWFAVR